MIVCHSRLGFGDKAGQRREVEGPAGKERKEKSKKIVF
jgi:hypothetical protein